MDTILIILGIICLITGIAGCFLPVLPGPPVAYLGILFLHFTDKVQYSGTQLLIWLLIVIITLVLDYFIPMLGSKYSGGSKWGNRGCLIGTIVGLFFLPWGIIAGPFFGAKRSFSCYKIRVGVFSRILTGNCIKIYRMPLLYIHIHNKSY